MKRLVLASSNPGKLREFARLLAPLAIELVPQAALGIPDAEEPHPTFLENALAKARHASRLAGLPAMADDSGLCVAALAGAPGVHSARFAGESGPREHVDATRDGRPEPLCAIYEPATLARFQRQVAGGGNTSPRGWLEAGRPVLLQAPAVDQLDSINTREDLRRLAPSAVNHPAR